MSSPPTLGPFESAMLRATGEFIVDGVVPLMGATMFWGMYAAIVTFALWSLCRKAITSRARLIMLIVVLIMFAMSTTMLALQSYSFFIQTKLIHLEDTLEGQTFGEKTLPAWMKFQTANFVLNEIFAVEFLIGDAVVIWRTWVLWPGQLWVMIFPISIWLASLATFLASSAIYGLDSGPESIFGVTFSNLLIANWSLSIGANAVATSLIAYKAWQHRKMLKESLGSKKKKTQVERVLVLLVESGFIYLVLWGIQSLNWSSTEPRYGPYLIFVKTIMAIGHQTVGLYPTIIIVIVDLQKTIWDSAELNISDLSSIRFSAARPPLTGTATGTVSHMVQIGSNDSDSESTSQNQGRREDKNMVYMQFLSPLHSVYSLYIYACANHDSLTSGLLLSQELKNDSPFIGIGRNPMFP